MNTWHTNSVRSARYCDQHDKYKFQCCGSIDQSSAIERVYEKYKNEDCFEKIQAYLRVPR